MALLDISNISAQMDEHFHAKILNYRLVDDSKYAVYNIQLTIGEYTWTIERRFSEFDSFDQVKFQNRKKSFLPPKKLVGNMGPEFLEERKRELEKYVKAILELEVWHQKQKGINSLSLSTARFFDFHQYEVHSIVDDLSIRLGSVGEEWLTTSAVSPKYFEFTPIEMFAITKRLCLAEPTAPDSKMAADIGNTIDFLHRVRALKVRGAKGYVGTSNIVWNSLEFSLQFCKNLLALWITDSDVLRVKCIWTLKDSLRRLVIHYSMKQIKDLLLDEEPPIPISEMEPWTSLEEADFSFNEVEELDETVRLLGKVQILNLSHNSLKDIGPHLQHLTNLTELNLSHNSISCVDGWNLVLGNIKKLTLAGNQIENVDGLSKLYALEYLDLKENRVENIESMQSLGRLPCLEVLILRGNAIRKIVDYRSKAFEVFGDRAKEIKLDSRLADARELDTVRVRLALKQAKLEKEEKERKRRERIEERVRYISGEVDSLRPGSL